MRSVRYGILIALAAAVLAVGPGRVRADVITHQALIPPQPTNWNQLVSIPQFDPATGDLLFIVVRLSANFQASVLAENFSATPAFITASLSESIAVSPPVWPILAASAAIVENTQAVGPHDNIPLGGTDTAFWWLTATVVSTAQTSYEPHLDAFRGLGDVPFGVEALADFSVTSTAGKTMIQISSQAGMSLEVEYHFVPEPATLSLLLVGLALWRPARRRRLAPRA